MKKRNFGIIIFWIIFLLVFLIPIFITAYRIMGKFFKNMMILLGIEIVYFIILKAFKLLKPKGEWIVESAMRNGRVVKARRVGEVKQKTRASSKQEGSEWVHDGYYDEYSAKYEYEVNGRTYKYKEVFYTEPSDEIELFYPIGRPSKAISERESHRIYGFRWTFLVVIIPVVMFLVMVVISGPIGAIK